MSIWKNGEILPDSAATVSVYDSGWMYGDSVFETTRSFNTKPFKLEEHFDRLIQSAELAMLEHPFTKEYMISGYNSLLAANPWTRDEEHRAMIHLSRGLLPIYGKPEPWLMMTVTPLRQVLKGYYEKYQNGVHVIVPEQRQLLHVDCRIKHRSRLHFRIAEEQVRAKDKDAWAVLASQEGDIAEATGANVFVRESGEWWTPMSDCLEGVSRNYVMRFMYDGVSVENDELWPDTMDEMFLTATPFCIMPVTKLNGQPVGDGKPGPVTREIMRKWIDAVGCDWVEQCRDW